MVLVRWCPEIARLISPRGLDGGPQRPGRPCDRTVLRVASGQNGALTVGCRRPTDTVSQSTPPPRPTPDKTTLSGRDSSLR